MENTNQVSFALIINVISFILTNWLGLSLDNQAITTTVETLIVIGTAVWALIAHKKAVVAASHR